MSETAAAPDWTEAGRKLFGASCEFIFAAARSDIPRFDQRANSYWTIVGTIHRSFSGSSWPSFSL